ncbi:hypothetical protein B0H19DRAFT_1121474 [Mycena capillaripes]|nr:hypothetical protein B0H19DRAFT_1121474 [Mycena capillaripes]
MVAPALQSVPHRHELPETTVETSAGSISALDGASATHAGRRPLVSGVCSNCGPTVSRSWHRSVTGARLCNPCGCYEKRRKQPRPSKLFYSGKMS